MGNIKDGLRDHQAKLPKEPKVISKKTATLTPAEVEYIQFLGKYLTDQFNQLQQSMAGSFLNFVATSRLEYAPACVLRFQLDLSKDKDQLRYDTFGAVPRDDNRQPLTNFQNYFMTTDSTSTPLVSPLTVASNAVTTLKVPAAAITLTIVSSAALRISEESTAAANYFVIPANTVFTVPCMSTQLGVTTTGFLYLKGDSGSCTVQFMFNNI